MKRENPALAACLLGLVVCLPGLAGCAGTQGGDAQIVDAAARTEQGDSLIGAVVDATGSPIRARVSAVVRNGSYTTSTDANGTFLLGGLRFRRCTLTVTTPGGEIACRTNVVTNPEPLVVAATQPGAWLSLSLTGDEDARVSVVTRDGTRVHDFTLRAGADAVDVVVPTGPLEVRVGDDVRPLELEAGEVTPLAFASPLAPLIPRP